MLYRDGNSSRAIGDGQPCWHKPIIEIQRSRDIEIFGFQDNFGSS